MQGKVAIITGASRGIGRETALLFAKAGFNVVATAFEEDELNILRQELEHLACPEFMIICGDLADMDFVISIPAKALKKFGRIDILVNNAAWRTIETMRNIELLTWEKTLKVCLTAPAFLARSCAAVMEKNKIKGVIINTSSIMSGQAGGNSPAYIASKGALDSLTKELAVTYGRSGIRVVSIKPGFIDTSMSSDYSSENGENISEKMAKELLDYIPLNNPGSVIDIARAVLWISSDDASYITGCELIIDGGLSQNFSSYPIKKLQFPQEY